VGRSLERRVRRVLAVRVRDPALRSAPAASPAAAHRPGGVLVLGRQDGGPDGPADDLEARRVLALNLELGEGGQRLEGGLGVIHGCLRVAVREAPGIGDPREAEDRLRHVADGEADAARGGTERHHHRAGASLHLERERVGPAAAAFPAAAASEDLHDLELRPVDRPADRRADLATFRPTEADEPVAVAHDDRDSELEASTGVGHALDHVHVEDLVVKSRQELVDDLGFAQRETALERGRHGGDLVGRDTTAELGLRHPRRGRGRAARAGALRRSGHGRAHGLASARGTSSGSFILYASRG